MSKKLKMKKRRRKRKMRGRKGDERGKGLESRLEQKCCLSRWGSRTNSTE